MLLPYIKHSTRLENKEGSTVCGAFFLYSPITSHNSISWLLEILTHLHAHRFSSSTMFKMSILTITITTLHQVPLHTSCSQYVAFSTPPQSRQAICKEVVLSPFFHTIFYLQPLTCTDEFLIACLIVGRRAIIKKKKIHAG